MVDNGGNAVILVHMESLRDKTMFEVERVKLPEDISYEMRLWREGLCGCDKYIAFHKELAQKRLKSLERDYGIRVHNEWIETDGWFDGFRCLHVVVETRKEKLLKLRWMDSNQDFGVIGSGTSKLFEEDLI